MGDILLLTVDSLREDHFTREYFPKTWSLIDSEFTRFDNAFSNGVATPLSFPSIHTGRQVSGDGTLNVESPTVAEVYNGYSFGISNNPHLRKERGYHRGFDFFTDRLDDPDRGLIDDIKNMARGFETFRSVYQRFQDVVAKYMEPNLSPTNNRTAGRVLDELRDGMADQQGFFWAHLMDPHYPFIPQKVMDRNLDVEISNSEIRRINDAFVEAGEEDGNTDLTENEIEFLQEMYGEIVKYLDRQLAEFFEEMRTDERWRDMNIVLTSDHGEAFGEQGIFSHDWAAEPIDALVRIPLAVKYPGDIHGDVDGEYHHPVQNADIFASLATLHDWEVTPPDNTRPLTDPSSRAIVSKSNTSVRVTTESGYAIRRGGSVRVTGTIDAETRSILKAATLPSVETLSGDVPGLDEREQRRLKRRLDELGYK